MTSGKSGPGARTAQDPRRDRTAITRAERLFKSSRTKYSRRDISVIPLVFETPTRRQKLRSDSGVYPRRRIPEMVGMRGSSHPWTNPCWTNRSSFRLLSTG